VRAEHEHGGRRRPGREHGEDEHDEQAPAHLGDGTVRRLAKLQKCASLLDSSQQRAALLATGVLVVVLLVVGLLVVRIALGRPGMQVDLEALQQLVASVLVDRRVV